GMVTGGELFIRLSLKSEDSESLRRLSVDLEASGGLGAWSGSASVSALRQVREAARTFELTGEINRIGSREPTPNIRDQNALIDYALSFPVHVNGADAVPFRALIMPYQYVFHPDSSPIDRQNQFETLNNAWLIRNKLVSNLYDYDYALSHPEEFNGLDVARV